jgi:hypothetical protein
MLESIISTSCRVNLLFEELRFAIRAQLKLMMHIDQYKILKFSELIKKEEMAFWSSHQG